jgi:sucrose phosphorylase
VFLYGVERAEPVLERLVDMLERFSREHPDLASRMGTEGSDSHRVTEKDAILITYADIIQEQGKTGLQSLNDFLQQYAGDAINSVHLLPFFPYSSDDGFSVIDYRVVDPAVGDWDDVAEIGLARRLMFDAVINHVSSQSDWFQRYLENEEPYSRFFIESAEDADLSQVFRPRALPLLTKVETAAGPKHVWTTFSADQIDLNFGNPDVLLEIIDLLLDYVSKGAEFIRLDAIAYLWKEPGTSCIHLPQTHRVVQLFRSVLDLAAPNVSLITETNVPHQDNISYFGNGTNEAQMVYNFSLPPLLLHTFHQGNAQTLSEWASTLASPSDETTFFNFTASHDGIGILPARDILDVEDIEAIVKNVESRGGYVSYKDNPDGTKSPYELNMNYLDALGSAAEKDENPEMISKRFLASQAIMLALRGVPGIYFHSLVGSRGWRDGVQLKGFPRAINREKLNREQLDKELLADLSVRRLVHQGYIKLLDCRLNNRAFHPFGEQEILAVDQSLFSVLRTWPDDGSQVLCLHNVSEDEQTINLDFRDYPLNSRTGYRDILSGKIMIPRSGAIQSLLFSPFEYLWLAPL